MSESPNVAVIDDGELDDIRAILEELGCDFAHWSKSEVPSRLPEPQRLLVTTASRAASLGFRRTEPMHPRSPTWIVVSSSRLHAQRRQFLQAGFNFLVCRPVHPAALRLLLQRALYGDEDQRRVSRVAVGYEIAFQAGLRQRPATLVDLSPRGCRLLTRHPLSRGTPVQLEFPPGIAQGTVFRHKAQVVRSRPGQFEGGEEGEVSLGLRFERFTDEGKTRMIEMLRALSRGPATLSREASGASQSAPSGRQSAVDSSQAPVEERRRNPRGIYERQVPAFGEAEFVLLGRDLSSNGMRVDPHPALTLGDEMRLTIETGAQEDPIVVGGMVIRDDGEHGQALRFQWVQYGAEERLDALVRSLAPIERLTPEPDADKRVVLSRLLPQLLRVSRKP
jgi:hypothetical protein